MNSVVVLISGSTGIAAPTIRLARESGARVFVASLEDDVDGTIVLADVEQGGDVRVRQGGQPPRAFHERGAARC